MRCATMRCRYSGNPELAPKLPYRFMRGKEDFERSISLQNVYCCYYHYAMKYRIYSIPRKVESVAKRRGRAPLRAKKKKSTKVAATDSSFELTPAHSYSHSSSDKSTEIADSSSFNPASVLDDFSSAHSESSSSDV